jgi:hypothetical protein
MTSEDKHNLAIFAKAFVGKRVTDKEIKAMSDPDLAYVVDAWRRKKRTSNLFSLIDALERDNVDPAPYIDAILRVNPQQSFYD